MRQLYLLARFRSLMNSADCWCRISELRDSFSKAPTNSDTCRNKVSTERMKWCLMFRQMRESMLRQKHCTCALLAIHRKVSPLIGPNDILRYVTFCLLSRPNIILRRSDKWIFISSNWLPPHLSLRYDLPNGLWRIHICIFYQKNKQVFFIKMWYILCFYFSTVEKSF